MRSILLATVLLVLVGCKDKLPEYSPDKPDVDESEQVYYRNTGGIPVAPGKRLGGISHSPRTVQNQEYHAWLAFKGTVGKWAGYLAVVAIVGLLAGIALLIYKVPVAKDVLLVSAGSLLVCGALALFVQFAVWLIGAGVVVFVGYWGYVLWRKQQDELVQRELVQSGEVIKGEHWTDATRIQLRNLQSKATRKVVDRVQLDIG